MPNAEEAPAKEGVDAEEATSKPSIAAEEATPKAEEAEAASREKTEAEESPAKAGTESDAAAPKDGPAPEEAADKPRAESDEAPTKGRTEAEEAAPKARTESDDAPTKAEIAEFLKRNEVDDRAAQDLRDCPPELQRKVLDRGDLNSARNSSAALIVRIRDARMDARGSNGPRVSMGLPSSKDIDEFIKDYGVDDQAAEALRSSSPTMKRNVLNSEEFRHTNDVSSLLLARIRSRGGSRGNLTQEVEAFLRAHDIDARAATDLRQSPPSVQRAVLNRGEFKGVHNTSSALLARIRDAKAGVDPSNMAAYAGYPGYPPYGYGYPPPGYPGYGYPPGYSGYPGYGYPPSAYGYPPPGAYGYPPAGGAAVPSAAPKKTKGGRSGSYSSYSYSYSPSPSKSRSRSRRRSESRRRSRSRGRSSSRKSRRGARRKNSRGKRDRGRRR